MNKAFRSDNPVVVQSDRSILLETGGPRYEAARDALAPFAELVKSPEYIHTYRISPLSLWNASAAGMTADDVLRALDEFAKYEVPANVASDVRQQMGRYGKIRLVKEIDGSLVLVSDDDILVTDILHMKSVLPYLDTRLDRTRLLVKTGMRGHVKQALIKVGWPVEDLAGYVEGAALELALRDGALSGRAFGLRQYQWDAVNAFHLDGSSRGGAGVIVLPCGAGKTIVGMGVMSKVKTHTLILTTNITALHQWRAELIDKTTIDPASIGEYSGEVKEIRPITLTTYQILTYRKAREEQFTHFGLFNNQDWGLIIYDEVHLLPAPVFRATAELQARRRLGLTATLIREDGHEDDVFSLIGPKRHDVPWKTLEREGWIATAECAEIRVPFADDVLRMKYATAEQKEKFRVASENPAKLGVIDAILEKHPDAHVLVIGQYIDQLELVSQRTGAPIITGRTPNKVRDELYAKFKAGEIRVLVVSKVANFAIDLPDANVAVQISGTFGSRQEEAQRLGRILRPKADGTIARFYSVVTQDTNEQEFAQKRQLFLCEQGYRYDIVCERQGEEEKDKGNHRDAEAQRSAGEEIGGMKEGVGTVAG